MGDGYQQTPGEQGRDGQREEEKVGEEETTESHVAIDYIFMSVCEIRSPRVTTNCDIQVCRLPL